MSRSELSIELSFGGNSGEQLRSIVERLERVNEVIKALNEDKSDIYAEAKGNGFDTKIIRTLVKERRHDAAAIAEEQQILEVYRAALAGAPSRGMGEQ